MSETEFLVLVLCAFILNVLLLVLVLFYCIVTDMDLPGSEIKIELN